LFFGHTRPTFEYLYQKIIQLELTSVNMKFAYHITNIFFKQIKFLIHFILSSTWIHIQKAKLSNRVLTTSDVSSNVNLNKILKLNLGFHELTHIITFFDYLYHLQKDVFAMIKKFGPPTFFVTFSTSVINWFILMKTLKYLHTKHFQQNVKTIFNNLLMDKYFVRNDLITCVQYYEHKMNCFCKLFLKIDIMFGKVQFFFIIEFQYGGLTDDHKLI
jgi:hypothetical protein